ncbi:hypothetical protein IQ07DRAFT_686224 [Pyrenochaeta sp. DS3sAY3a]|nr:hypothetical protein IQ07DRAFT_686224 [Pyrenochaeta sp. DS3sAY3a]
MEPRRNVLILKGNVSAENVLDLLDVLLRNIQNRNGLQRAPEPWQIFSFICASGVSSPLAILLGRLKKGTEDCRAVLKLIHEHYFRLCAVPSSYTAWAGFLTLRRSLAEICDNSRLVHGPETADKRCDIFIWKPRKTDEPSDHITTHNYDITNPASVGTSTLDALLSSLCVQEDPYPEHPFHGLVNAAKASSDLLHNGDIYVSIRSPAKDDREEFSEHETMNNMRDISHFAFVVDNADPNSFPTQKAIEPAVEALARWLEYSSEQADDGSVEDRMVDLREYSVRSGYGRAE